MSDYICQLSATARKAVFGRDWRTVDACAQEILRQEAQSAEGFFLAGLADKAARQVERAATAFARAMELDDTRYDAAVELANQHCNARRHADALELVTRYEADLQNSPLYLNMAGTVYSAVGMPEKAWPLYTRADKLQPGVDLFLSNIAACAVFLGKFDDARRIYRQLLQRHPAHQRYHYQLAQLGRAEDYRHVEEMQAVIRSTGLSHDKNVFMYYAIGKELEDLEQWDEAFAWFRKAGDAVASVARYDIDADLRLIDKLIEVCSAGWLREGQPTEMPPGSKTPIFIVGLPRTGTTLTDRIIASHSRVKSVDETQYMQMVIRRESGIISDEKMTPAMVEAAAGLDIDDIRDGYMELLTHKLGDEAFFADKLPFNVFYLGFIAKAFPKARIVLVNRNPMDACFAMYKHVFTWAYKFSYTLDGLGRFYPAYTRLINHWRQLLGDRIIDVGYEQLVADQEGETRRLLGQLGLGFEQGCLEFDRNRSATLTASAAQVREKIHSRSVNRWQRYAAQLQPLKDQLDQAGIR